MKLLTALLLLAAQTAGAAVHRLEATPATVAYGYYWSEAKPALRITSGDVIDVDTLLTNTPQGLQRAGVPPEKIQESLKNVVAEVTGDRRGPGGHILTGPVYVEGAEPGDGDRSLPAKIIPIDKKTRTSTFAPGIVMRMRLRVTGVTPAPYATSECFRPLTLIASSRRPRHPSFIDPTSQRLQHRFVSTGWNLKQTAADARQRIASAVLGGAYTAEDLLRNYTTLLYAKTPNYSQVADKLQVDRRTVRARVDAALLDELKG